MKRALVLTACIVFVALPALGDQRVEISNQRQYTFHNTNCERTKTCDLKQVDFFTNHYRVLIDDEYSYGAHLVARYRTDSLSSTKDYGFVSFIRGCIYEIWRKKGIATNQSVVMYSFDETVPFFFKKWVIDSIDSDPLYNSSSPPKPRHSLYRWNEIPGSFTKEAEHFYEEKAPVLPELYVTDNPSTAFATDLIERNVSLEHKMCLYKTEDIPLETTRDNIDFGKPITCFSWRSSFIYSEESQSYESPQKISPMCKKVQQ